MPPRDECWKGRSYVQGEGQAEAHANFSHHAILPATHGTSARGTLEDCCSEQLDSMFAQSLPCPAVPGLAALWPLLTRVLCVKGWHVLGYVVLKTATPLLPLAKRGIMGKTMGFDLELENQHVALGPHHLYGSFIFCSCAP